MGALSAAFGRVLNVCGGVAAIMVLAMTAVIVLDVLLRNLSPVTLPGGVEITEYGLFLAAAFAAPWLLREGQHIRIDLIIVRLPRLVGWCAELVADAIGLALSIMLTWYGVVMTLRSFNAGTMITKELRFPEWLALWPLPLMFALVTIEFIFRFHRLITGPRQARQEGGKI